jgi:hypothetical protein
MGKNSITQATSVAHLTPTYLNLVEAAVGSNEPSHTICRQQAPIAGVCASTSMQDA